MVNDNNTGTTYRRLPPQSTQICPRNILASYDQQWQTLLITKAEPWSRVIKRRRLNWWGHLMHLHRETPALLSLKEALRPTKRSIGHPKNTYLAELHLQRLRNCIDLNKISPRLIWPAQKSSQRQRQLETNRAKVNGRRSTWRVTDDIWLHP